MNGLRCVSFIFFRRVPMFNVIPEDTDVSEIDNLTVVSRANGKFLN